MAETASLLALDKLCNPNNYGPVERGVGNIASSACVDKRLVSRGGHVRTPGGILGPATAMVLGGQAETLQEGIAMAGRAMSLNPNMHEGGCAFAHNLGEVVGSIAARNSQPSNRFAELAEAASRQRFNSGGTRAWEVELPGALERITERAARLKDALPSETELRGYMVEHYDGDALMPVSVPTVDRPEAFVMDLARRPAENAVVQEGVLAPGEIYLDTSVQAFADAPVEVAASGLWLADETAQLVADTFLIPVIGIEQEPHGQFSPFYF